jgi:hypothetical protein
MSKESFVECWRDPLTLATRFSGSIHDRDYHFSPQAMAEAVKSEIVSRIAAHVLEKLTPAIDKAIIEAFQKFNEESEDDT